VNPELKLKPIRNVFEGDYFSLYPTIILAYNISIETLVPEDKVASYEPQQLRKVILNYRSGMEDQEKKFVYFIRPEVRKGIFPALVERILE